jgi:hypothetical protein
MKTRPVSLALAAGLLLCAAPARAEVQRMRIPSGVQVVRGKAGSVLLRACCIDSMRGPATEADSFLGVAPSVRVRRLKNGKVVGSASLSAVLGKWLELRGAENDHFLRACVLDPSADYEIRVSRLGPGLVGATREDLSTLLAVTRAEPARLKAMLRLDDFERDLVAVVGRHSLLYREHLERRNTLEASLLDPDARSSDLVSRHVRTLAKLFGRNGPDLARFLILLGGEFNPSAAGTQALRKLLDIEISEVYGPAFEAQRKRFVAMRTAAERGGYHEEARAYVERFLIQGKCADLATATKAARQYARASQRDAWQQRWLLRDHGPAGWPLRRYRGEARSVLAALDVKVDALAAIERLCATYPALARPKGTLRVDDALLRRRLKETRKGPIPPTWVVHRLVTIDTPAVLQFFVRLQEAGYDVNDPAGALALPTLASLAKHHETLPAAAAPALASYQAEVRRRVAELAAAHQQAQQKWANADLLARFREVEKGIARDLLDPQHPLRLSKDCPFKNAGVHDLIAELGEKDPKKRERARRLLESNDPAVHKSVPELPRALARPKEPDPTKQAAKKEPPRAADLGKPREEEPPKKKKVTEEEDP